MSTVQVGIFSCPNSNFPNRCQKKTNKKPRDSISTRTPNIAVIRNTKLSEYHNEL